MATYPLIEHEKLEYPHDCYGWDDKKNAPIRTMSDTKIRNVLKAIRKEEQLLTTWEVPGIDQRHMDQPIPFPVRSLKLSKDSGFVLTFPKDMENHLNSQVLTWLDLWRAADSLYRLEGLSADNLDKTYIVGFFKGDGDDFELELE